MKAPVDEVDELWIEVGRQLPGLRLKLPRSSFECRDHDDYLILTCWTEGVGIQERLAETAETRPASVVVSFAMDRLVKVARSMDHYAAWRPVI